MTDEEMSEFKRIRLARWQRAQASLKAWQPGGPTWKPAMTDQQRREHEQYVINHQLPF